MKTATIKRYFALAVTMASLVIGDRTVYGYVPVEPEPSQVSRPSLFYQNRTAIMVIWPNPSMPLDYYQLDVIVHYGLTVHKLLTDTALFFSLSYHASRTFSYIVDRNHYFVRVADCLDRSNNVELTSFLVRSVVNRNGQLLYGPWSPSNDVECVLPDNILVFLMRATAWMFVLVCTMYFLLFVLKVWHKYKVMSDVQIILPRFHRFYTRGKNDKTGLVGPGYGNISVGNVQVRNNVDLEAIIITV